jgi:predicted MFS family arabinose efflux permease
MTESLRGARAGAFIALLSVSVLISGWATRIPQIKAAAGLSDETLGLVLLAAPIASILAVRPAPALLRRYGSRTLTRAVLLVLGLAAGPLGALHQAAQLGAALAVLGGAAALLVTAVNAQGVAIERVHGKPVMSTLHSGYSLGGLVGSLLGALAARLSIAPAPHLAVMALLATSAALAGTFGMLPAGAESAGPQSAAEGRGAGAGEGAPSRPARLVRSPALRSRRLWLLAAIVFCAFLSEGAMNDWSALFLREQAGAAAGTAAFGLACFSCAMFLGRTAGDRVFARFGPARAVRCGALAGACGLAGGLAGSSPVPSILGFGLAGLGMSATGPAVFSAAGRVREVPTATALSLVSAVGGIGLLIGPGVIGLLAQHLGLGGALLLPVALVACAALLAPALGGRDEARPEDTAARARPEPAPTPSVS